MGDLPMILQLGSDGVLTLTMIYFTLEFVYLAPQLKCLPTQTWYLKVRKVSKKTRERMECWRLNCGAEPQPSSSCSGAYSLMLSFTVLCSIADFLNKNLTSCDPADFLVALGAHGEHWYEPVRLNQGLWRDIDRSHFILNPII